MHACTYSSCMYMYACTRLQVVPAKCTYTLQVRVRSYSNPQQKDYEGKCCDISLFNCGACEPDFKFCARSYGTSATYNTCPSSSVYYTSAAIPGSPSSYNFNTQGQLYSGAGVNNPLVFTGNSWPVSLPLYTSTFKELYIHNSR